MPYRPNEYVSARQAALELGVDEATIRRACAKGKLPSVLVDGRYIILWRDAEDWKPGKPGRPRKKESGSGQ